MPEVLPRWVALPADDGEGAAHSLVRLQDVIRHDREGLFPGMTVNELMPFRLTRNAEVEIDDDESPEDLVALVEEVRRFTTTDWSPSWRRLATPPSTAP